ncbi:MAG: 5-bromo-4-chloroindolyl phosphate hydrolysis family protein [Lachnospiraceae bacterium]|nr:5-bromo-4-chloroindolyl phosphate hydrolysis family protein [Lachnospiraceae bacterium]
MSTQDNNQLGDQILNLVQKAFDSMDFQGLSEEIGKSINRALEESRQKMRQAQQAAATGRWSVDDQGRTSDAGEQPAAQTAAQPTVRKRLPIKQVGRISNQVSMLIGGLGMSIGALTTFFVTMMSSASQYPGGVALGLGFFLPVTLLFGALFGKGFIGKRRLDRLNQYVRAMKGVPYISVAELSSRTGISEKQVVKDLKKMIAIGIFPQGHLNQKEDYFMLDDVSYQQYREAYANYLEMEKQKDVESKLSQEEKEVRAMLATGENYITQIRAANDAIPGVEVTQKLDRLEFIISRIFEAVQKYPEKRSELERFLEYYMPTTLKLVNTYKMLDEQPVQGENIKTAKAEIEKTLDSINTAYEKLYDDMFQAVAWDISTDISVMENMFAREGLKQEDFKTTTLGS